MFEAVKATSLFFSYHRVNKILISMAESTSQQADRDPNRQLHMNPRNPLKAPLLPLTLSDEASSEAPGFLSLVGLSLMFCAPPIMRS
jgi:hypothetical protein